MIKTLLLLAIIFVAAFGATDRQILQLLLNGAFQQNKFPDPKTVVQCFDDKSAHDTVIFVGTFLDKGASGSITDLLDMKQMIEQFQNNLPPAVRDCVYTNPQLTALGYLYGITPTTNLSDVEKKIIEYVTLHYLNVHKWLTLLDNSWHSAKYYQVGYDFATYGHSVLPAQLASQEIDKQTPQKQILKEILKLSQLLNTKTFIECFDDKSVQNSIVFFKAVLEKAAKRSEVDLFHFWGNIQQFYNSIVKPIKNCLDKKFEFKLGSGKKISKSSLRNN